MTTEIKVHELGPGLPLPRINAGPVCDDSAAEGSISAKYPT